MAARRPLTFQEMSFLGDILINIMEGPGELAKIGELLLNDFRLNNLKIILISPTNAKEFEFAVLRDIVLLYFSL